VPILYEDFSPQSLFGTPDSQLVLTILPIGVPQNSLYVADYITGKPVANATVSAGGKTYTTDSTGLATLDLPNGTYSAQVTSPNYLSKTVTVTIPLTSPLTVKLIPDWGIALGIVGGTTIITGILATVFWRKR
jgi:hypothetical protein